MFRPMLPFPSPKTQMNLEDLDLADALALLLPTVYDSPALHSEICKASLTPRRAVNASPRTPHSHRKPLTPSREAASICNASSSLGFQYAPMSLLLLCGVTAPSAHPRLWYLASSLMTPPTHFEFLYNDYAKREEAHKKRLEEHYKEKEETHLKECTHTPAISKPAGKPLLVSEKNSLAVFNKNIAWAQKREDKLEQKRIAAEKEKEEACCPLRGVPNPFSDSKAIPNSVKRDKALALTLLCEEQRSFAPIPVRSSPFPVTWERQRHVSPSRPLWRHKEPSSSADKIPSSPTEAQRRTPRQQSHSLSLNLSIKKPYKARSYFPEKPSYRPAVNTNSLKILQGRPRTPVHERYKTPPRRGRSGTPEQTPRRALTAEKLEAFTKRSELWVRTRQKRLYAATKSLEKEFHDQCTFTPKIRKNPFLQWQPQMISDPTDDPMEADLKEWFEELCPARQKWVPSDEVEREYRKLEKHLGLSWNSKVNIEASCGKRVYWQDFLRMMREPVFRK